MNSVETDIDPFSEVAQEYDAAFTRLPSVVLLRERIHELVRRYFPPSGIVLDLSCGTGEDAVMLASQGFHVIGADQSRGMLAEAAAKSNAKGQSAEFVQVNAASLSMFRDKSFDAILSNFGGLNCVPDLRSTLCECHRLLRPGGTMVLCLLGANSVWESVAFALRGSVKGMLRRRIGVSIPVPVGTRTVATWYHPVRFIREDVESLFDIVTIVGLNVVAPPPSSRSFMRRHPRLSHLLYAIDRKVQSVPLMRSLGDHTVYVLRWSERA